jgi:Uma2 family endonuclease
VAHRTIFTYHDYILMPEGRRYEVLGGDLVGLPAPTSVHQEIVGALYAALRQWAMRSGGGRALVSPVDVRLSDTDVVQPDVLFVTAARAAIIEEPYVRAAPDLVIEVLSASTAERDRVLKRRIYELHGVREYWIVDPDARAAEVLTNGDDGLQVRRTCSLEKVLASPLLPGFSLRVAEIFQGLGS